MLEQLEAKDTWEEGVMSTEVWMVECSGEVREEEEEEVKSEWNVELWECFWCGNVDRLC